MEGLQIVAKLMALAAKTAPKGFGKDYLDIQILDGATIDKLAGEMRQCALETGRQGFVVDAESLKRASVIVLVGLKDAPSAGLDCAACGFASCKEMEAQKRVDGSFKGPQCVVRLTDLGIAIGSAVSTAAYHHADNRIMLNVGVAARRLKISNANYLVGIPLAAEAKNPFFDRK